MLTRTKLNITFYTIGILSFLFVFSRPLRIPEEFQFLIFVGLFILLGMSINFIKKQKSGKKGPVSEANSVVLPTANQTQSAKRKLIVLMALALVVGLCAPLWLPLIGNSLGIQMDLAAGIFGGAVICVICGIKLKKL
jgi:hypothetical protein